MSQPCTTCQPMPACVDDVERYSLQSDNYLFVLNCPPGYDCSRLGTVYMICCDGTEYLVQLSQAMLVTERDRIFKAMLEECARKRAFCEPYNPDPPLGPEPPTTDDPTVLGSIALYWNSPQTAKVACPSGGEFSYTVPAGKFLAYSQAVADSRAKLEAVNYAKAHFMCLSSLPVIFCEGTAVSANLKVYGPSLGALHLWTLVSGALPDGLALTTGWIPGTQAELSGTATVPGSFTFKVRAQGQDNLFIEREFTMCVIGISPASLPDPTLAAPYSQTLTATGCATPPLSWQIVAGSLPEGLSLNEETGQISGTPTQAGIFNITVELQTEAT